MRILLLWAVAARLHGNAVDQLLTLPAPVRDWKQAIHYVEAPQSSDGPSADAPLDRIAEYWAAGFDPVVVPAPEVRERLVAAVDTRPDLLPELVKLLPVREDVIRLVRKAAGSVKDPGEHVTQWLLFHDPAERPRLIDAARNAHDAESYVEGEEALAALAEADWNAAAPLLTLFMNGKQPYIRARALALTFGHARGAERDSLRRVLRSIVADAAAPAGARDRALKALLADDWPGRDSWLISLMHDPTFSFVVDGGFGYTFAGQVAESDPDHWIPIMIKLLDNDDRAVRSAAANALGQFNSERTRVDALRPIVRWIAEPKWADDFIGERLRLVQSVAHAGLREAIPALVVAVENDPNKSVRAYAAQALADFHDARGNAAMRRAFAASTDSYDATIIVKALLVTGGLSPDEIAAGMVEAARNRKPEDSFFDLKGSTPETIGVVAFQFARQDDAVAQALIARHQARPADEAILKALYRTDTPSTARFLATHLGEDDAELLAAAIGHGDSLRAHASEELRRVAAGEGVAAAIATLLLGDAKATAARLAHGPIQERRALLAAASIRGEPLDIRAVAALFGITPPLDQAVEAYLSANDTPPARAAIYAQHPGQARILGGGEETFPEWEEEWRKRVVAGEVDEVIALVSDGYFSNRNAAAEITFHAGKVSVKVDGKDVPVSGPAIAELRAFLRSSDFDNLPPLLTQVSDGLQFEYLHLTRDGGARVFMNNPGVADYGTPYGEVVRRLRMLQQAR
jgi:HEAT repeat protein